MTNPDLRARHAARCVAPHGVHSHAVPSAPSPPAAPQRRAARRAGKVIELTGKAP